MIPLVCILALWSRRAPAVVFALAALVHDLIGFDGWAYYLSAAAFDLCVLAVVAVFCRPSRTATALVYVCQASIALNFFGWGLWLSYHPPLVYDITFLILYALVAFIIMTGDGTRNEKPNYSGVVHHFRRKSVAIERTLSQEARR